MYTTIKGRYEGGKVILEENPPVEEADVVVVFQEALRPVPKKPVFGAAKGIITYMADDFDEPLEDMKDYM